MSIYYDIAVNIIVISYDMYSFESFLTLACGGLLSIVSLKYATPLHVVFDLV